MAKGASLRHGSRRPIASPPTPATSLAWLDTRGGSFALFGLILAAAAAVRLWGLAYRDLWFDELGAIAMASTGDWWMGEGGNPPLFFAILRGWIRAFGTAIAVVRLPSALAGIAAVAALWWVAAELHLSPSRRACGAALFACSPLQIYYSQETRAYALLVLLVLLALGSFLRAVVTGSRAWWAAHGVFVVGGLYTHNLMIPMVGAFWASALVLRVPRIRWIELAVVHGMAVAAYTPWIPRLFEQAASDSHRWIAEMVGGASSTALVLRSIEAFNIGGWWPDHLNFPVSLQALPWSALFFAMATLMVVLVAWRARRERSALTRSLGILLLLAAWPIAFLVAYSAVRSPLYLVGRYDLPAHAPYLLLMGVGVHELMRRGERFGRAVALLPVAALVVLSFVALTPKLAHGNDKAAEHRSQRIAAELAASAAPDDLVVALDVANHLASYVVEHARVPLTVYKFPHARLDHLDPAPLSQEIRSRLAIFRREAAELAARARGRRIWLIESPIYDDLEKPRNAFEILKQVLMAELREHAVRTTAPAPTLYPLHVWLLDPRR
jgi:4-amino-4-deoxy-L-arabinose transferase-like glycosyltransferase